MNENNANRPDARTRTDFLARAFGALAAVTLALGIPFLPGGAKAQNTSDPVPFTVSILKGNALSYLPVVAMETGIWKKHGLNVSFVNVTNGPAFISSVQSGSADGGVTAFSLTLPAEEKGGKRMVAIAGDIGVASYAIAVRPEIADRFKGDWRAIAQALKGTRFGVPALGGEVSFVFQGFLGAAGIDPQKDLTLLQSGAFAASSAALRRGDIDAYIGSSYAQLLGLEDAKLAKIVLDLNTADPFKKWVQTAFFVAEPMAKAKPETVKRAREALRETHAWIKDPANFASAHKIASDIFPIGEVAMRDFITRFKFELDRESVEANLNFFRKANIIKIPAKYEELVLQ